MNRNALRAYMARQGDTQAILAEAMGISKSRLNAKINETGGAEFRQTEIEFIARRYALTAEEVLRCFFAKLVS